MNVENQMKQNGERDSVLWRQCTKAVAKRRERNSLPFSINNSDCYKEVLEEYNKRVRIKKERKK